MAQAVAEAATEGCVRCGGPRVRVESTTGGYLSPFCGPCRFHEANNDRLGWHA